MTCIFPGRFEPFHNGHLMVVQGMMNACGKVVIIICHNASKELFDAEEIREMISASLLDENIVDANIVLLEDCDSDEEWGDKVLEAAGHPEDAKVWSGREEILDLFEGMDVATQKIVHVPGIDGDEIRVMIANKDGGWRTKVPGGAMRVIDDKTME